MENFLGLLRVHVKCGVNLAVRDVSSSDPYVVVKMGKQKLKTRVINNDINPEWNEDLTLSISDPDIPIKLERLITRVMKQEKIRGAGVADSWVFLQEILQFFFNLPIYIQNKTVYDHDTFTMDDKMGEAEFDIKPFLEAKKINCLDELPDGTIVARVQPSRKNCLSEESCVRWSDGKITQDLCLRLRDVECGEIELSLHWIDLPVQAAAATWMG